jgi:hypothetical protein
MRACTFAARVALSVLSIVLALAGCGWERDNPCEGDQPPPDAPQWLRADGPDGSAQVELEWSDVDTTESCAGQISYELERCASPLEVPVPPPPFVAIAAVDSTHLLDTLGTAAVLWAYRVRAVDYCGRRSAWSVHGVPFPPDSLEVSDPDPDGRVRLRWTAVDCFIGLCQGISYELQYRDMCQVDTSFAPLATVDTTGFVDAVTVPRAYRVRAVDDLHARSAWSAVHETSVPEVGCGPTRRPNPPEFSRGEDP